MNQVIRPRRLRETSALRAMVQEFQLSASDFIAPLFVVEGVNQRIPIEAMPGQDRLSIDLLIEEVRGLCELGVRGVVLFPVFESTLKDSLATHCLDEKGLYPRAIAAVKKAEPRMLIMTDVALDPYSLDGHDGLVDPNTGRILNDETLELLAKMAVIQARAGADLIGPSDMMDGRVGAIRSALDQAGFQEKGIISYTAKYASHYYGPFRDALDSAPKAGDKKTYQMNFANKREALIEMDLDIREGADILMVKPGLAYLDILSQMRERTNKPLAVYNVSGEYSMIKAAGAAGFLDEKKVMMETLMSFKRAGADIILTYFAREAALLLKEQA